MRFANPEILWLMLAVIPLLTAFFWWSWKTRRRLIALFVQSRLLAQLTVGVSGRLRKIRMTLLTVSVGLLFLVLAQPQWGVHWEEARQRGLDIVIAIDTSRSMMAADAAPNRFSRAKFAALDLMRLARTDRLGLIAFSGSAFLQCPLTLDDGAFQQSLDALNVGIIPQGGTAIEAAIRTALKATESENQNFKILVLFTDGENHEDGAVEAAREAAEAGMRIFTVGVGTPQGELLQQVDAEGNLSYIKDEAGRVVKSRLNQDLLLEIATITNGAYLPLSGVKTMETLYDRSLAPLPKSEIASRQTRSYHERYQWPLGAAMLLLIVELFVPEQRKAIRPGVATPSGAALLPLLLFLWMTAMPTPLLASAREAQRLYNEGQFSEALRKYDALLEKRPDEPILHFNAGTAAFKAGDLDAAKEHFYNAQTASDLNVQQATYYNLGNLMFEQGTKATAPEETMEAWRKAIQHYEASLKLDSLDQDAEHNRDHVKKMLEQLEQQQQQQQQEQEPNQDQENSDSESDESEDQEGQEDPGDEQDQSSEQQQQQDPSDQAEQEEQSSSQPNSDDAGSEEDQGKETENQAGSESDKETEPESASDPQQTPGETDEARDEASEAAGNQANAIAGKMTPEQAQQLLNSLQDQEKAMIFKPTGKPTRRAIKEW